MISLLDIVVAFVLAAVLGYDVWLWRSGRPTISETYQALLPTWIDVLILAPVLAGIYFLPVHRALGIFLAMLAGHVFFPNKERHI